MSEYTLCFQKSPLQTHELLPNELVCSPCIEKQKKYQEIKEIE